MRELGIKIIKCVKKVAVTVIEILSSTVMLL